MDLDQEYAFWHVLARDVAYMAQPRGARIDGHLAAAAWIDDHGGRREDVAGVVAHHLATALELAEAARDPREATIRPMAREALTEAASNAMGLDVEAASGLYARALDLAPSGTPERLALLRSYGVAAASPLAPTTRSRHWRRRSRWPNRRVTRSRSGARWSRCCCRCRRSRTTAG